MQLTPSPGRRAPAAARDGVRAGLAAATCVLLGPIPGSARAGQVDGTTLVYSEPNRVTAVETAVEGTKDLENGGSLHLKVVYDALTGASANGATPAAHVQTFTGPSGNGSYTVRPGQTPLDPTFKDTRLAGSATWTHLLGRLSQSTLGANLSAERDYTSVGISGGITRDLAMRNTTLAAGLSLAHDTVRPKGGTPTAFTPLGTSVGGGREGDDFAGSGLSLAAGEDDGGEGGLGPGGPSRGKNVVDALVGVTQVLDRATIARVNYSLGYTSGYLTDPYKILSVVQAQGDTDPGEPVQYLYEHRPDRRTRRSVYGEIRRMIASDVATASYRYYWDSWSVRSSTVDVHFSHRLNENTAVEPHFRHYHQDQADFYTRFLVAGRTLPHFASSDYRLGTFTANTYGLQVTHALDSGVTLRFGLEYYLQQGDSSPPGAFGSLARQNLFPDVSAWMVRVGATLPVKGW